MAKIYIYGDRYHIDQTKAAVDVLVKDAIHGLAAVSFGARKETGEQAGTNGRLFIAPGLAVFTTD